MFRKRRLSDSSLEKILSDPYVRHAFVTFMEGDEREDMAQFWLECEGYQTISFDAVDAKKRKAESIFNRFFKDKFLLNLDQPTVLDIEKVLKVKDGKVQQNDPEQLARVFNLAANKCFQYLKFECMSRFLVSNEFKKMKESTQYFKDFDDMARKSATLFQNIPLGIVLAHPVGEYHFLKFLSECEVENTDSPESFRGVLVA